MAIGTRRPSKRFAIVAGSVPIALVLVAATLVLGRWKLKHDSIRRAEAAFEAGAFPESHREALDHLRRWPEDRSALLLAARSLSRMGRPDRAESLYRRAGDLTREDRHIRAAAFLDLRRHDEAAALYREIVDRWPDDVRALQKLAALEMARNRVPDALALADRLAAIPDGAVVGQTMRGVIYHNARIPEHAVPALERVLALDPELKTMPLDPPRLFWDHLGNDLLILGRARDARRYLERALRDYPDDASLMDLLAHSFEQLGDLDRAERCWRKAVARDPDLMNSWLNLGQIALARGHDAEAITLFDRAALLVPTAPEPLYGMSMAHRRLGDLDRAEQLLRKADQLREPGDGPAGN